MEDIIIELSGFIVGAINAILAMFDIEPITFEDEEKGFLRTIIDAIKGI